MMGPAIVPSRGNERRETTANYCRRHIATDRYPIIFGGFGLDFAQLNIEDCRLKGSTLGRTTIGLLKENFGLSTRLIHCNFMINVEW